MGATFATVTGEGLFLFFAQTLVNGLLGLQLLQRSARTRCNGRADMAAHGDAEWVEMEAACRDFPLLSYAQVHLLLPRGVTKETRSPFLGTIRRF